MNNVRILAADASRRAALLVTCIRPVCALLAPCLAGASTSRIAHVIHRRVLKHGRHAEAGYLINVARGGLTEVPRDFLSLPIVFRPES
ncbi:MAG: hypothetical protein ABJA98_35280, partial [Acidobacteriota bacterium]